LVCCNKKNLAALQRTAQLTVTNFTPPSASKHGKKGFKGIKSFCGTLKNLRLRRTWSCLSITDKNTEKDPTRVRIYGYVLSQKWVAVKNCFSCSCSLVYLSRCGFYRHFLKLKQNSTSGKRHCC
jgi:hypothetical protein